MYTESESQGWVTDPGKRGWRSDYGLGKLSWSFSDWGGAAESSRGKVSPGLWVLSDLHLLYAWVVRNPALCIPTGFSY